MSLKEVKNTIIQEAEQKAEQNRNEAEKRREEIISEAEQRAEEIREDAREERKEEKESLRQKAISNANIEAKRIKLQAKQDSIEEVFEEFRSRLSDLNEDQRKSFIENAVELVDFQVSRIEAGEEYMDLTDHEYSQIDSEGFILVSDDGRTRQNFTVERVLEKFREENRRQVAQTLFDTE
jgi:Archaeal/vacuolar-type H+-ATPase subunit E